MEYSGVIITNLIRFQMTVILVVMRLVFYWALRYIDIYCNPHRDPSSSSSAAAGVDQYRISSPLPVGCLPSPCSYPSGADDHHMIRNNLLDVTSSYEHITRPRLPESCNTCAVCLDELMKTDKVTELRNCCHVFHRKCIERWLNYHNVNVVHKITTCPLCRSPLLEAAVSSSSSRSSNLDPSWVVERLLYLFGDDLDPLSL